MEEVLNVQGAPESPRRLVTNVNSRRSPRPRRPESGAIGWVRGSDRYIFPKLLWQRYRQGTWEFCPHRQYPLAPPRFDKGNACFATLRKAFCPVLPT